MLNNGKPSGKIPSFQIWILIMWQHAVVLFSNNPVLFCYFLEDIKQIPSQ